MNDIDRFLQIKTNSLKPAKGRLLLSEPFMGDYYFGRSVILLAEHNEEGTVGVILNKPAIAGFNEVLKDFPEFDSPVYIGGPVETNSLFYIHTIGKQIEGSVEINGGLFWGGDIEAIKEMILLKMIKPNDIRFYIGYSGWGEDQLKSELERNSWLVAPTDKDSIFNTDPLAMWNKFIEKMGNEYRYWTKFPIDPNMN
jgi:putative transcriptional regulator